VLLAPLALISGPYLFGLSWGLLGIDRMTLLESVLTQFFAR